MATAGVLTRESSTSSSKRRSKRLSKGVHAYNNSRVKLYLRCRKAYWFRYDSHGKPGAELVPKHEALPLKKGSWMHDLLQAHWLEQAGEGHGWMHRNTEMATIFYNRFDEEIERYGDLPKECARLMEGYVRRWRNEDSAFRVATLPSGEPAIEFVVEVPLDKWGIESPFKGRIDLLVEDLEYGGLWIRDAKWVRSVPGPDERMMSPQNLLYVWACRRAGLDVRGFIYDYGRTAEPTVPRILKRGNRKTGSLAGHVSTAKCDTTVPVYLQQIVAAHGKKQARELIHTYYGDMLKTLRQREVLWYRRERIPVEPERIKRGLAEFIQAVREIERRKKKGAIPRTYLYNCKWNCSYHEPCVAQFQGLDIAPLLKRRYQLEQESYAVEENELVG